MAFYKGDLHQKQSQFLNMMRKYCSRRFYILQEMVVLNDISIQHLHWMCYQRNTSAYRVQHRFHQSRPKMRCSAFIYRLITSIVALSMATRATCTCLPRQETCPCLNSLHRPSKDVTITWLKDHRHTSQHIFLLWCFDCKTSVPWMNRKWWRLLEWRGVPEIHIGEIHWKVVNVIITKYV